MTCIGEAKSIFSRASSIDHKLCDALSLVSSICTRVSHKQAAYKTSLAREHLVQPIEQTLLVLLGNHFKRPWRHKICKALIDLVVEFYPRVQVSPCTPKLPWTFRVLPCRQCTRKGGRRSTQASTAHDEDCKLCYVEGSSALDETCKLVKDLFFECDGSGSFQVAGLLCLDEAVSSTSSSLSSKAVC